jgi:hypothetical protein
MLLKSEWRVKNKIKAIGALDIPELKYSFGIIKWRLDKINKNWGENYKGTNNL